MVTFYFVGTTYLGFLATIYEKHYSFTDMYDFMSNFDPFSDMLTHEHLCFWWPCVKQTNTATHFINQ